MTPDTEALIEEARAHLDLPGSPTPLTADLIRRLVAALQDSKDPANENKTADEGRWEYRVVRADGSELGKFIKRSKADEWTVEPLSCTVEQRWVQRGKWQPAPSLVVDSPSGWEEVQ